MHRIDTPDAVAGLFTDGNPAIPQLATYPDAAWENALQEEIANVVEGEGIALSKPDNTQLRAAIASMISRLGFGMRYVAANAAVTPGIYFVDSWAGPFSLTLPAAPTDASLFHFIDVSGTWSTNNVTLLRNGKTIETFASDLVLMVSGTDFKLAFNVALNDWKLV